MGSILLFGLLSFATIINSGGLCITSGAREVKIDGGKSKEMYPFRKELVGKRFLFVRSSDKGSRPSSRSTRASNSLDLQWKSGVIRACNEKDCNAKELQVSGRNVGTVKNLNYLETLLISWPELCIMDYIVKES